MPLESGSKEGLRGVVKCRSCKNWQSWISYSRQKIIEGRRMRSDCLKCGKRNTFRLHPKYHKTKSPVVFTRCDDNTSRENLVKYAQLLNSEDREIGVIESLSFIQASDVEL